MSLNAVILLSCAFTGIGVLVFAIGLFLNYKKGSLGEGNNNA